MYLRTLVILQPTPGLNPAREAHGEVLNSALVSGFDSEYPFPLLFLPLRGEISPVHSKTRGTART